MATEASGLDALRSAFDRFYNTVDATTVPAEGGGRKIAGSAHGVALSEANDLLARELLRVHLREMDRHEQIVSGPSATVTGDLTLSTSKVGGEGDATDRC